MTSNATPPSRSDLVAALSSSSEAVFHGALGQLSAVQDLAGGGGVALVVEVVAALEARDDLEERGRADRFHALLRSVQLREAALTELAHRAKAFSAGVRNALSTFLTPRQRRLLLRRDPPAPPKSLETADLVGAEASLEPGSSIVSSAERVVSGPAVESPDEAASAYMAVILLAGPYQDANTTLLRSRQLDPIVWGSLDKLEADLATNDDICGCIVDGSVLQTLDKHQQLRLFKVLGQYSTFIWIRVDASQLKLPTADVRECLRQTYCLREGVPAERFSVQPNGALQAHEIDDPLAASRALRASSRATFVPGELRTGEARILMAAARVYARELKMDGVLELRSLQTRFLPGGPEARIAVLRVNNGGRPIIAKIDKKERIVDEMVRFRTFIEAWDVELRPKLHFHGSAAVLLFGLIAKDNDESQPAEVLQDRLEELWNLELFPKDDGGIDVLREALAEGVRSTVRRLGDLNERPPPTSDRRPNNPSVEIFRGLLNSGMDWGLPAVASTALERAWVRFSTLAVSATVHGDVHLRNVLVRGDRDAHLIDYAGSGPGHPAVDLARLELALFLGPLRQLTSEAQCVEYQKRLTFEGATAETLEQKFPALHRSHINRVCLVGCAVARDRAIDVAKTHGGGAEDYQAAKYILAWQNLVMMGRQTGLARVTIEALAPVIAAW